MHFIVALSPRPDAVEALRQALGRVSRASAAESGCRSFAVLEAVRPPVTFVIHSSWLDEAAFDHHAGLAHTLQFLNEASALVTYPIKGWRLRDAAGVIQHEGWECGDDCRKGPNGLRENS